MPRNSASKSTSGSIASGAFLGVLQVSTIGQPLEVLKTHLAAHRNDTFLMAMRKTWARGGILGYYQGLFPWAILEASTKGAILLVSSRQAEKLTLRALPGNLPVAGMVGGIVGGLAQAYAVMGFTTTMKTIEITRQRQIGTPFSTFEICRQIYAREGLKGLNKGVNAVAMRQMTTWSSRMGISRLTESLIRRVTGQDPSARLGAGAKIASSCLGGALSCWNQPFEVLRIEMQSAAKKESSQQLNMLQTATRIYRENGLKGFFRGISPRIALGASVTTFMVAGGDLIS